MYKTLDGRVYTHCGKTVDVTFDRESHEVPGDKARTWNALHNIREKKCMVRSCQTRWRQMTTRLAHAHTTKPMISYLWLATNESLDVKRIRMHSLR